jgi:hypothetical protein
MEAFCLILNSGDLEDETTVNGVTLGDSLNSTPITLRANYTSGVPFVQRRVSGVDYSLEPTSIKNGAIASSPGFFSGSDPTNWPTDRSTTTRQTLLSTTPRFQDGLSRSGNYLTKRFFWVRVSQRDGGLTAYYTCWIVNGCYASGNCDICGTEVVVTRGCTVSYESCYGDQRAEPGQWPCGCGAFAHCCYYTYCKSCNYSCNVTNGCSYWFYRWYITYDRYFWMNTVWIYYDRPSEVFAGEGGSQTSPLF